VAGIIEERQVVVTGVGCISAAGSGMDFWRTLLRGRPAFSKAERFDTRGFGTPLIGAIRDFDPDQHIDKRITIQTDRHTQFGMAAAELALDDAGLEQARLDPYRVGVVMSNNLGGSVFGEEQLVNLHTRGARHVSAYMAIAWFYAATIGQISIRHGFKGYSKTHIGERAGGLIALGDAAAAIRRGELDVCVAGGCEAPISPYAMLGYADAGLLSASGRYAPFGIGRDGLVIGEGGAVLILEEREHARRRDARIYAEVAGFGHTCDAVDHKEGAEDGAQYARAIRLALSRAGLNLPEVGLVLPDAAGGGCTDAREARAIRQSFGKHTPSLLVACPKALFGHTFGAAGVFDAAIACLSLYNRCVPPIRDGIEIDPDCWLPLVVDRSPFLYSRAALVLGTGRGGINAAFVVRAAF
jgi:3-oxoacyl-(acyl-carrier-protein) synthase